MEGCGCLRAEGENRPSRPNHVVLGVDLYNGQITGNKACNMNANSNASANHAGPSMLILNDQGGDIMNVNYDVTCTLRAEDHGHPPILCAAFMGGQGAKARSIAYCDDGTTPTIKSVMSGGNTIPDVVYSFEPGIMKRDCSAGNRAYKDICSTLRAQMGDNQPAVAYPINLMVATRGGKDDMRTCFGVGEPNDPQFTLSAAHEHGVCYEK